MSISVSSRTIDRRLLFFGVLEVKNSKAVWSVFVGEKSTLVGLAVCYNSWRVRDTSRLKLDNKVVYVWIKPEERWRTQCLEIVRRRPNLSAIFWGCRPITYDVAGTLVPVEGIIDFKKYTDILDTNLWPFFAKRFSYKSWIFQDDNAPVHSSKFTQDLKKGNGIYGMT